MGIKIKEMGNINKDIIILLLLFVEFEFNI